MKLIVCANTMEVPNFYAFMAASGVEHPESAVAICGDLLNVFPEPGEDLEASIFYEIYGNLIVEEMARLRATRFDDIAASRFIGPLQDMFGAKGPTRRVAEHIAAARYEQVFERLRQVLGERHLFITPGNMDYPAMLALHCRRYPNMHYLDGSCVTVDGICLGGVGGIPRTSQPFHPTVDISPYERSDEDFAAAFVAVEAAQVVLTHASPAESPLVERFIEKGGAQVLLCRAPFELTRSTGSRRGVSRIHYQGNMLMVSTRPFEAQENHAFVVDIRDNRVPDIEIFAWVPEQSRYDAAATSPFPH
jgi:hypothetical protein